MSSGCATDATTAGDVGVGASGVSSARVVNVVGLHEDLNVDLVHVLWNTKEASGKVLGGFDHTILRLSAEDRESLGGGEVVEQLAVELTVLDTELEVLAAAKGSQELSTELVGPSSEKTELAGGPEAVACLGCVGNLGGESGRGGTTGRVTSTVTVQKLHLVDGAASWDVGAGVGKTVVGRADRVPGSQVTPESTDVDLVTQVVCRAMGLGQNQWEGLGRSVVVRVSRSGLSRSRLDTSHAGADY